MTGSTTPATVWPRLAAPGTTRPKGPCPRALSPSRVRPPASTIRDRPAPVAAEPII